MSDTSTAPSLRHLLSIDFRTERAVSPGHPEGDRYLLTITSGAFHGVGPSGRFEGRVLHGSDWVTRRADGSLELDVRTELQGADGTTLLMTYTGISHEGTVITTPRFSAPFNSSFAWLNQRVCLAKGTVRDGGVSYDVWSLAP